MARRSWSTERQRAMREIEFRGKIIGSGEWAYGAYLQTSHDIGYIYIINEDGNDWEDDETIDVIQDTVGQYTGVKDMDGFRIFEGDVLAIREYDHSISYYEAVYAMGGFNLFSNEVGWEDMLAANRGRVIGNIHDSPELVQYRQRRETCDRM